MIKMRVPFRSGSPSARQPEMMVTLTHKGMEQADRFCGSDEMQSIMSSLYTHRPQSIGQLAKANDLHPSHCRQLCVHLAKKGLIQASNCGQG